MPTDGIKGRLTVIVIACVRGDGRLTGENEAGFVTRLQSCQERISGVIYQCQGRVLDVPGDSLLAEFESAVNAVACAVRIQEELRASNSESTENRKMEFRIGINLGEVVVDEKQTHGDVIHIAARMEGLAEAGGICISGAVYDQVENKLRLGFDRLEDQELERIDKPIRVYRVTQTPGSSSSRLFMGDRAGVKRWRGASLVVAIGLFIVAGALMIRDFTMRPSVPQGGVAPFKKLFFPIAAKPAIAVLPFVNLTGDPEQALFTDGITVDIIMALSRIPNLLVIDGAATSTLRKTAVGVRHVAEEPGVRYVLEGSVRRSADRLWVTTQLLDATTGHALWTERFDREVKGLFALEGEIVLKIVTALQLQWNSR